MVGVVVVFYLLIPFGVFAQVPIVVDGHWDTLYTNFTEPNSTLTIYRFPMEKQGAVVRVFVSSNDSDLASPLLVVFRERKAIISLQVPIVIQNAQFAIAGRTLCPFSEGKGNEQLTVEMSSYNRVKYQFRALVVHDFMLDTGVTRNVSASASEPVYLQYDIPEGVDSVVVNVESNSSVCMTVSIQPIGCPVFDLTNNVISAGFHQTMTTSASIAVERSRMPQFYVIFVVNPNNNLCSEMRDVVPIRPTISPAIVKRMNVTISGMQKDDYILPMCVASGVICVIYLFAIIFMVADYKSEMKFIDSRAAFENDIAVNTASQRIDVEEEILRDDDSVRSYDTLPDFRDMLVRRAKRKLMVADLSLKEWTFRDKKYSIYWVTISTIGLFYGLPVVQLVLTWQNTVRLSGDFDLCWYNFRCAKPFLGFIAFNNLFSNTGYVFLGLLLIIMNKEKELRYRRLIEKMPELEKNFGLPEHSGLTNAIGVAVIFEGVLSASYHICPSSSNYQFDTSFMYVIGMLGMLKIYQLRHPDINANAHVAFAVVAFFILIAMCGVYMHNLVFWIVFSTIYMITLICISIEFYFKGFWQLNSRELWHSVRYAFLSSRRCSCLVPSYAGRFIFLVLANLVNISFVTYGVWLRPKDFGSFLLLPFIANLFLYLIYYIVMKCGYREKLHPRALVILFLAALCWLVSGIFFLNGVADWSKTPSKSRELNRQCLVLNFFDNHDIWHFLSSIAIFLSFTLINRIDDDLIFVPRDEIVVF